MRESVMLAVASVSNANDVIWREAGRNVGPIEEQVFTLVHPLLVILNLAAFHDARHLFSFFYLGLTLRPFAKLEQ